MRFSPLKFSFGVSIVVHGLAIGGALLLAQFHQTKATTQVSNAATLELIAAPSSPQDSLEQMPAPVPPAMPASLPPAPVPETLIPEPPAALPPAEDSAAPQLAPLPEPVTPVAAAAVATTTTPSSAPQPPTPERGDNSSATPGRDATTAEGKPTANARPDYLKNPEPVYPIAARRRHQEGLVLLSVRVNPVGRATSVSLKQSSGYPLLDEAALTQVREWEFTPARIGSFAVESDIEVPVRFKLMN